MQSLIPASVCLLLAATVLAQKPHPCKSPPLLVGRVSLVYPKGQLFVFERFSYDAFGQRVRVRLGGVDHNQTFHKDYLLLYREGLVYEISYRNHTCSKMALEIPFQPMEIPHDATFQAQVIIGSSSAPGEGLLVNNFIGDFPHSEGKYFLTFTEFGCIPITSLTYSATAGYFLASYFDIVIGIEDPEEFIPPDFCDTSKPVEDGEPVTDLFEALLQKNNQ
ncbi:hypothetical protein AAFF_G00342730 [Aldrovandia affinis]|uniref:Ependymin-like protein n=1 Tax=Aldrovandia affinis TaxID=143900 RepID=A0AAD7VZK3_9TELE|nr:hypothetical protein AAFF_G00342730 [Aldrovandia affinis]